jgi:hypothetical protein
VSGPGVGVGVAVGTGVKVGVEVGVAVGVAVDVGTGVRVGVAVEVGVGTGVAVGAVNRHPRASHKAMTHRTIHRFFIAVLRSCSLHISDRARVSARFDRASPVYRSWSYLQYTPFCPAFPEDVLSAA